MPTLTQVSESQADKTTTINEIAEALSMAGLFGIRRDATTGLTFAYYGGEIWVNGVLTTIANGTTALAAASTNYVEATTAGVVSDNATGFSAGQIPLFTVTTNASGITAITDHRITNLPMWGNLVKSIAGGAGDTTLTAAEARADSIRLTGAITGNRTVTMPAVPWAKVFYNDTSGAFTVTVKTSSVGSPIPATVAITQGKTAVLWSDGEHVHSATTDKAAFGLGTMSTQNANAVAITGGAINGTPAGETTPAAGAFTTLSATALVDISGAAAGQIKFPAAQNASSDANTLDDYEEGTFTATLSFGGASTGITYDSRVTRYVKIGKCVHYFIRMQLSSKGTSTGAAQISGMPFTFVNVSSAYQGAPAGMSGTYNSMAQPPQFQGTANATTLDIYQFTASSYLVVDDTNFNNTSFFSLNNWYEAEQ